MHPVVYYALTSAVLIQLNVNPVKMQTLSFILPCLVLGSREYNIVHISCPYLTAQKTVNKVKGSILARVMLLALLADVTDQTNDLP